MAKHAEILIGKFDILATYTYAKALLDGTDPGGSAAYQPSGKRVPRTAAVLVARVVLVSGTHDVVAADHQIKFVVIQNLIVIHVSLLLCLGRDHSLSIDGRSSTGYRSLVVVTCVTDQNKRSAKFKH